MFVDVENDPLTLAEGAKDRAVESTRLEVDLGSIVIPNDDSGSRHGVVQLDDALHSLDLLHLPGSNAGRADTGTAGVRPMLDTDHLDVGEPAPVIALVREADGASVAWLLTAHFTAVGHTGSNLAGGGTSQ